MASLTKSRTLFAFTSPRTIEKIIPEIRLLDERFAGQKWNAKLQEAYFGALFDSDFYEGEARPKDPAFAARDRITRAPKALGFVDLKDSVAITPAGKALLNGKRVDEVITRQLLKFQLPSPNHTQSSEVTFGVKPYLELLRLTKELDGISMTEIALFFTQMTHYRHYGDVMKKIQRFREQSRQNRKNRKEFVEEQFQIQLKKIYAAEIRAGVTGTRESADSSLAKFLATKRSNLRDYADAFVRYLRATKLVTFNVQTSRLRISEFRQADVDFILQSVRREPENFSNKGNFNAWLFDSQQPALLSDDRGALERKLEMLGLTAINKTKNIEWLKDQIEILEAEAAKNQMEELTGSLKSFDGFQEIEAVFEQIRNREIPDAPLYFEWNIWRAMVMLNDAINITGNFRLDLDGAPLSSAPGNTPDIECEYENFNLIVEVTLSSGQKQFEMEGEPVARHYGKAQQLSEKPTYCLFVANKLNPGAVAHFFNLNRLNTAAYGGKTRIIPISLDVFRGMLLKAKEANFQDARYLEFFLKSVVESGRAAKDDEDELGWLAVIREKAGNWCRV